jgi:bilirubin oxidase
MRFTVGDRVGSDTSTPPGQLASLPAEPKPPASTVTRSVSLSEADSAVLAGVGPRAAFLGTTSNGEAVPLGWHDPITENPAVGATETWEIVNTTEDAHPIHLHLVQFQVVNRQPFGGTARGPEPTETGLKDMVIAYPGETTRLRARFDKAGLYVWHCHIVEHEDNEMMRPYRIGPPQTGQPD